MDVVVAVGLKSGTAWKKVLVAERGSMHGACRPVASQCLHSDETLFSSLGTFEQRYLCHAHSVLGCFPK